MTPSLVLPRRLRLSTSISRERMSLRQLPRILLATAADDDTDGGAAPSPFPSPRPSSFAAPFRPGIAVIVGVLTIIFSLTFLLLLYARHCKRSAASYGAGGRGASGGFPPSSSSATERRHSGVERAVVESLPVFKFGALRGQKEGLECAVCLCRFEPAEALRLLPKCRHAFHVECVDTWLDAHSTCPLCRVRVDPEDVLLVPRAVAPGRESHGGAAEKDDIRVDGDATAAAVPYPSGRRISGRHSSAGERSSDPLQIVVRCTEPAPSRLRRSADCSGFANAAPTSATRPRVRKDSILPTEAVEDRDAFERRHSHRIVVSDFDGRLDRWSDLRPTDLLFLRREMIITESGRFSASKAVRALSSPSAAEGIATPRCASEFPGVRRMRSGGESDRATATAMGGSGARRVVEEERTLRRWLDFAAMRTAARWLGKRESGNGPDA